MKFLAWHLSMWQRAAGTGGTGDGGVVYLGAVRNPNEEQIMLPVRVLNGARTVPVRCPYGARTVPVLAVRVLNGARTFD